MQFVLRERVVFSYRRVFEKGCVLYPRKLPKYLADIGPEGGASVILLGKNPSGGRSHLFPRSAVEKQKG